MTCSDEQLARLKSILWAAQDLIEEGRKDDNMDGVVAATDTLMVALDDYTEHHESDNPREVQ